MFFGFKPKHVQRATNTASEISGSPRWIFLSGESIQGALGAPQALGAVEVPLPKPCPEILARTVAGCESADGCGNWSGGNRWPDFRDWKFDES